MIKSRALIEKERRRAVARERRFCHPLKAFIERKYPAIMEEYVILYGYIDFMEPHRKDLTTSRIFKQWFEANPPATAQQNISQARDTLQTAQQNISQARDTLQTAQQNISQTVDTQQTAQQNIQQSALTPLDDVTYAEILADLLTPGPFQGVENFYEPFDFSEVEFNT